MDMSKHRRVLVIGVGHPQRGDDALGWHLVDALRDRVPPNVEMRALSGEATALLEAWATADAVVVVDAMMSNSDPGRIRRFDAIREALPRSGFGVSSHGFGVVEAIELGRRLDALPGSLIILGVEGRDFNLGAPLSPPVLRSLDEVGEAVLSEISAAC